ncbi:MAG: Helix-turn-helix transcriptional regulator [Candidatus Thermoplasmatota archaeon]|nr:Helix-turn-helix transcriptional regulator [Candidatus Thermoplasmatota archaeon]
MTLTDREKHIIEILGRGVNSPTLLSSELRITQSGATQALQKLERKGVVKRTKVGRNAIYRLVEEKPLEDHAPLDEDLELIKESYHALSRVWSHLLRLDLSHEELTKVREARNLLEEILVKRGKSLE